MLKYTYSLLLFFVFVFVLHFFAPDVSANSDPSINFSTIEIFHGNSTVEAFGQFTDPDISDTHTVVYDWGDGSSSEAATVPNPNEAGVWSWQTASHTYAAIGSYNVTLTITDNSGAFVQDSKTVTARKLTVTKVNDYTYNISFSGDPYTDGQCGEGKYIQFYAQSETRTDPEDPNTVIGTTLISLPALPVSTNPTATIYLPNGLWNFRAELGCTSELYSIDDLLGFVEFAGNTTTDPTFQFYNVTNSPYECTYQAANGNGDYFQHVCLGQNGGAVLVTPQQATAQILDQVNNLVTGGVLNSGQGNGLGNKLQKAIEKLNAGNTSGAISQLQAFINQVNDFISTGVLTSAQGQPLIDAAQEIVNSI